MPLVVVHDSRAGAVGRPAGRRAPDPARRRGGPQLARYQALLGAGGGGRRDRASWRRRRSRTRCWRSSWRACSATSTCAGSPAALPPTSCRPPRRSTSSIARRWRARTIRPGRWGSSSASSSTSAACWRASIRSRRARCGCSGLFSADGGAADLADLYQLVGTAGATDVVDFSLQLLPSLLETKRRPAAQRFSIDGYVSVERRGNLDALLPGELAHDDDVFEQKALSDDLLYYGHERQHERSRRLHYILVDASASMRGAREIFARGLALALAKKLSLQGGDVWLRFFDSRLSRAARRRAGGAARSAAPAGVPLGARPQHARVFADLAVEVARLARDEGRDMALTFITHAECHIPLATVDALAPTRTSTGSSCCRRGRSISTTCRAAPESGGDGGVAGAQRREAAARAGDRRGRGGALDARAARGDPAHPRARRPRAARGAARARRSRTTGSCSGTSRRRGRTTRAGSRARWAPTRRSAARGRPATCCWACAATPRRSGTSRRRSGRSSGRSARRGSGTTARRRACCRRAGHPVLAAIELEAAGASAAARLEWERVVRDPAPRRAPYETALAHFNLGEALAAHRRSAGGRRARSPRRSACSRRRPTRSRRAASRSGPSTATAFSSASARTPARSRTSPRAT